MLVNTGHTASSCLLTTHQVDAVVTNSINAHGFFAKAGPLAIFTSAHVRRWTVRVGCYSCHGGVG